MFGYTASATRGCTCCSPPVYHYVTNSIIDRHGFLRKPEYCLVIGDDAVDMLTFYDSPTALESCSSKRNMQGLN